MPEYIEREAVLDILCGKGAAWDAYAKVRSLPATDVRHVVRCKDCRHRDPEDHKCDCGQLERAGCAFPVDDEYYCAYGEE